MPLALVRPAKRITDVIHHRGALSFDGFDILLFYLASVVVRGASLRLRRFTTVCLPRKVHRVPPESFNIACTMLAGSRQYFLSVIVRSRGRMEKGGGRGGPARRMRIIDYQLTSLHAFPPLVAARRGRFYKPRVPGLHV